MHNNKIFEGKSGAQHPHLCHLMANIKIYKNTLHMLALDYTISKILEFQKFDLGNLGQNRGLQHAQSWDSMANINFYKRHSTHF